MRQRSRRGIAGAGHQQQGGQGHSRSPPHRRCPRAAAGFRSGRAYQRRERRAGRPGTRPDLAPTAKGSSVIAVACPGLRGSLQTRRPEHPAQSPNGILMRHCHDDGPWMEPPAGPLHGCVSQAVRPPQGKGCRRRTQAAPGKRLLRSVQAAGSPGGEPTRSARRRRSPEAEAAGDEIRTSARSSGDVTRTVAPESARYSAAAA